MSSIMGDTPILKVYGERNTGTNYLSQLLALNMRSTELPGAVPQWMARMTRSMPGRERFRDAYFRFTFSCYLGWKHSKVLPAAKLKHVPLATQAKFITLTKNPYSWLLSLYRRPYARRSPRAVSFESFVTSPWRTVGRDNTSVLLPSPVHLWNEKNASYLELESISSAIHLRYEDLLLNPVATLEQISRALDVGWKRGKFVNVEKSTKGDSSTFPEYRQYYLQKQWRKDLSSSVIHRINANLDPDVVRLYGYPLLPPCSAEFSGPVTE